MKIGFCKFSLGHACWAAGALLGCLLAGAGDATAAPGVLRVGPLETIKSIQQAVGVIAAGGTILVRDGVYRENILVDKPVTIRSEHGFEHATVVAADPSTHVFEVTAGGVTIEGFTVYGATEGQGIRLSSSSDFCTIAGNRLGLDAGHNNRYGLYIHFGGGHTIRGNQLLYNSVTGILLSLSDNNRIEANTANFNESRGISLSHSSGNLILGNHAFNNHVGISVSGASSISNRLIGNTCGYNIDGIALESASANLLAGNVANLNTYGLQLRLAASGNTVQNNEFNGNSQRGVYLSESSGNSLYFNDLMFNAAGNVLSSGSVNFWTTPKPVIYLYEGGLPYSDKNAMGNFYHNHGLGDLDTDGIADGVYALPGVEPDDVAPLTSERHYYNLDVHNRYPNDTVSALEDVAVLGSMTVFMDPADSAAAPVLVIEGKLTVGGF